MMEYESRLADKSLKRNLEAFGTMLIEGPEWCGRTTVAEQMTKSSIYFHDEDETPRYREMMAIKPSLLLKGDNPRLIDKWQTLPRIWDAIRFDVDRKSEEGLTIRNRKLTHFTREVGKTR